MQAFELSENTVWTVRQQGPEISQTVSQTVVRQFSKNANKNGALRVSDKVSDTVCHPLKCHCLSGCVSVGRASPDTQTKSNQTGGIRQ